ncbi:MAG TPA: helix-turn-helix domain-containing protein, partial [Stellaceae bacterium]|nr:helix-turn-helix domain-containing protein [Stellaceae bacterium]
MQDQIQMDAPTTDASAEPRQARRHTVGQLLRETREGIGSDLNRVATALRIRAAYLEAIEEGRYDQLPGAVYALGFVRAYATHLALDGEEAVRRFKLEAEGFEGQRGLTFPVPLAERSVPGGTMLLVAVILAICGYGLWYYLSSSAHPRPERVEAVPAELAPHPAATAQPQASVDAPATAVSATPTAAPPA